MKRLQIPYDRVLMNPTDFDPEGFDGVLRQFLARSADTPIIIEAFNEQIQYFVFLRERQFYWAVSVGPDGFEGITLREYFSRLRRAQFPRIVSYETSLMLYHSLIVYMQKKPDLKISSTLVDLDDLLDRTQDEHKNALISAVQPGNLVMLRYKEGHAVAHYDGLSIRKNGNTDHREGFLVKVYTMSAHAPFEIKLYSDLLVTHADDARHIPVEYADSIPSFFLSQPPKLVVKLKNRPLKTYSFTGKHLTIGRLPDNDIVIDNLGVSRKHAVIHSWKSGYLIKDLGSKNSTFLNGEKIDSCELKSGDVITIGKYQIVFQATTAEAEIPASLDQTVIIPGFSSKLADGTAGDISPGAGHKSSMENMRGSMRKSTPGQPAAGHSGASGPESPRLYRRSDHEEYDLDDKKIVIGRSKKADIRLSGLFAPRVTVEITKSGDDFVIQKTDGRKDICINGEALNEKVLEEEDLIAIGPEEFVFKR